jgi:hypothetical protein
MPTRPVHIALDHKPTGPLRFFPDEGSVTELGLEDEYEITPPANGTCCIDLPVKDTGCVRYFYELNGKQVGRFYLTPGADVNIDELLIAGGALPEAIFDHIERRLSYGGNGQGPKGDKGDTGNVGATGPTGPQGPIGNTGPQGAKGDTGNTGAQGPIGNTGAQGNPGAQGTPGAPGSNGTDGKTLRSGSGAPANGLGVDGDFYIDPIAQLIYGPKAAGVWPAGVNYKGAQGQQGSAGSQGQQGLPGTPGTQGIPGVQGPQGPSVGTAPFGYGPGVGGAVVQATNKATAVALNKLCGTITMNAVALAAAGIVSFTVTNTTVTATDVVHIQHDSGGTIGAYTVTANTMANGSFKITVRNNTAGSLAEAIVLRFAVVRASVT